MFIPAYFRKTDLRETEAFIRDHSFAILVSNVDNKPWATHIPLELEHKSNRESVLTGHISRANPQWKSFSNEETVMAIFQGPHSYVSSSWYNHINAPTWNYIAVHVYGSMRILNDDQQREKLRAMVERYEANSARPFSMDAMPEEMIQKYLKGIVGFELIIESIEGKWKMSQNRDEEDKLNIIRELGKLGELNASLVAEEIKKQFKSNV